MRDVCSTCGASVTGADAFCEACGAMLDGALAVDVTVPDPAWPPAGASTAVDSCRSCGGEVLADGYCSVCGQRALSVRDHWSECPAPWLGGVCDKGILHAHNEDAMALAAASDGSLGILVVCDGVTSAPDSDRAALAAARAANALLVAAPRPADVAVASAITHWTEMLDRACTEAQGAAVGVARSLGDPPEPPSCTFVAAIVGRVGEQGLATIAWCGDSRAYWVPDEGDAEPLSVDHSLGTELVLGGMTRDEAEKDPSFHTITRWLGADSPEPSPEVASRVLDRAGWVVVCSDGLWNYASLPESFAVRLAAAVEVAGHGPVAVCEELVRWANEQGGHDNITVALARWESSNPVRPNLTAGGV